MRIKEQRSLTIANRLPQLDMLQEFCEKDEEISDSVSRISSSIQDILGSLLHLGYELRAQNNQLSKTLPNEVSKVMKEPDTKQSRKRKRAYFTCDDDSDPISFYWNMIEEYHTRFVFRNCFIIFI